MKKDGLFLGVFRASPVRGEIAFVVAQMLVVVVVIGLVERRAIKREPLVFLPQGVGPFLQPLVLLTLGLGHAHSYTTADPQDDRDRVLRPGAPARWNGRHLHHGIVTRMSAGLVFTLDVMPPSTWMPT